MTEKLEGGEAESLTAEEAAFFESGGEKSPEATAAVDAGNDATRDAMADQAAADADADAKAVTDGPLRDEKGKFVPHQALHAEREEHKKTRAEMQELREFKARMEERWNLLAAQQQKQEPPAEEDPEPDKEKDIFAHNAWLARQNAKLAAKFSEREQAEKQAKEANAEEAQIWGHWEQSVVAVKSELPDFVEAAQFLSETRIKQLQGFVAVDPKYGGPSGLKAIHQQIDSELRQIIIAAKQNNINPAKAVYELAKSWGYTGPAPKQENGQLQLPEQLQRVADAQAASRTIAQAPGRAGGDEITLETLDSMGDAELSAWLDKPENARKFKQLMGG